jgi:virginiamycin A acetyltransferase
MLKKAAKLVANGVFVACVFPAAALTGFGRVSVLYNVFAQFMALVPGLPGDYLRTAYYFLTLQQSSMYSRVSFGTFFAQSSSTIAERVYIGAYCLLGSCHIGERTQIASQVQILSGSRQHSRDAQGRITGSEEGVFTAVSIGADCWIGAAAVIMADIGSGTTIGAGSVVTRPIPPNVVAVGNPARVIKELQV